jgi:hypothetical protein
MQQITGGQKKFTDIAYIRVWGNFCNECMLSHEETLDNSPVDWRQGNASNKITLNKEQYRIITLFAACCLRDWLFLTSSGSLRQMFTAGVYACNALGVDTWSCNDSRRTDMFGVMETKTTI